jgi:hypothetical protein
MPKHTNRVTPSSAVRPTSLGGQPSRLTRHTDDSVLELEAMERDPKNINSHVLWDFEDILGEPRKPRSVDM